MAEAAEYHDHHATSRLDELGLRESDLVEAVQWGVSHLLSSTANEPPSGPGIVVWVKTVRALREKLLPRHWTKDDTENYATVVSPDGSIVIAVAAGDHRTGKGGFPQPTTKNRKGKVTKKRVAMNQLAFEQILSAIPEARQIAGKETWILLIAVDENDEIVCELSLPDSIGKGGFISSWRERILLPSTPFAATADVDVDDDDDDDDDDGEPPIDIDIQPR